MGRERLSWAWRDDWVGGNQWTFNWCVGKGRGKNASNGRITEIKGLWQKTVETKDTRLLELGCLSGSSERERGWSRTI